MRKLPAVSEMEHITSKEFGENMDAILERVAKEDVALIIEKYYYESELARTGHKI